MRRLTFVCQLTGYKAQNCDWSWLLQQSCEADEETKALKDGMMGPELEFKVKALVLHSGEGKINLSNSCFKSENFWRTSIQTAYQYIRSEDTQEPLLMSLLLQTHLHPISPPLCLKRLTCMDHINGFPSPLSSVCLQQGALAEIGG